MHIFKLLCDSRSEQRPILTCCLCTNRRLISLRDRCLYGDTSRSLDCRACRSWSVYTCVGAEFQLAMTTITVRHTSKQAQSSCEAEGRDITQPKHLQSYVQFRYDKTNSYLDMHYHVLPHLRGDIFWIAVCCVDSAAGWAAAVHSTCPPRQRCQVCPTLSSGADRWYRPCLPHCGPTARTCEFVWRTACIHPNAVH